jgi:hypothetical protein
LKPPNGDAPRSEAPTSAVPTPRVVAPEVAPQRWPECAIPPIPPARGYESSATAELYPRYEDITQDGRVQLTTLMPGLGAVWGALGSDDKLEVFREHGILPILRRLIITGERGPFSVHVPISVSGTWRLARETDGDRIFLDMWLEARAPIAMTLAPPPARDAERVLVGRLYAEHVVTRPFASPAERKVTRLDLPGLRLPAVPEDAHPFEEAEALVAGHALEPVRDHVFGMMHTDSNQHVNSLVYPRLFEEAFVDTAVRAGVLTKPETLLARAVELRYRRPFFAGERATIALHARSISAGPRRAVAVGTFSPAGQTPGSPPPRPSCTVAMWLD